MRKALVSAIYLSAASLALASDLGGDGLGGPTLQPRANSAQLGEPGLSNRETAQVDPVLIEAGEPALDFRFAENKWMRDSVTNKQSLISFSRNAAQSPGTYVGADGLIRDAAVNFALYSEQFDNAAWTKGGRILNANQALAPDGKQTADHFIEQAGNANQQFYDSFSLVSGNEYTVSIYVKADIRTKCRLSLVTGGLADGFYVNADLSDGTSIGGTYGAGSVDNHSIENVGNGWYRISATGPASGSTVYFVFDILPDSGATPYVGDGISGIYLWGAQLEETDPATMQPTAYIKTESLQVAAPRFDHDPVTGESLGLLVEEQRTNLVLNSDTLATQNVTTTAAAHTLSFYGTGTVDLTGTYAATVVGTGAYPTRTTLTFTPTAGTLTVTVTGTVQYAQLETGSFPTSYIPTTASAQTRYADIAAVEDEDFATTNLLSYSESFDVKWSRGGMNPVSANQIAAPDGQTTADLATESTFTGTHVLYDSLVTAAADHTWSVYAKKKERTWIKLVLSTGATNGAFFDLDNGAVGTVDSGYSATIEDAGNGWYRCKLTKTTTAATHYTSVYLASDGSTTSYAGDGTSGVYLWGASLTATEYPVEYVTTRNLLKDSQDFERSSWTKSSLSSWYDGYRDPFGGDEGFRIVENSSLGTHGVVQNVTFQSADYVLSFYAKKGARSQLQIAISLADGNSFANFDLDAGTVIASGTGVTATIADVGNGWFRCTASKAIAAASTQTRIAILGFYVGDGASDFYLYGAQLEPGTTATDYVRTVDVVGKAYQWYEPTEGTVFVEADKISDYPNSAAASFESDANNVIAFGHRVGATPANTASAWIRNAGATGFFRDQSNSPDGWKMSLAFKHNDGNMATDGAIFGAADTAITLPVASRLQIGKYATVTSTLNGHIKRLTYWPRRQSDSTLQVITQ